MMCMGWMDLLRDGLCLLASVFAILKNSSLLLYCFEGVMDSDCVMSHIHVQFVSCKGCYQPHEIRSYY